MKVWLFVLFAVGALFAGSEDLDAQWVRQNSGTNANLTDVVMLDSVTAYAVSRGRSILRTTDRGETWFDLTAPLSYVMPWNGAAFYDSENGIVAGDDGTVFTVRGGNLAGWCRNITNKTNRLYSALYITPANIYVGADSGWVYNSLDSGKTWSAEKISEWPIRSLFAWRGVYIFGLPVYALTSHSICTKTEYPLTTWSEKVLPQLQGLGSEAFDGEFCNGGGPGFIVGVGGDLWASPLILRTSSSDTSGWVISSGVPGSGPLYGVSAPSENVVYACGVGGTVVKSTDGGGSWTRISPPSSVSLDRSLHAICFIDEKHGFAVGDSGTILYTSNGGLTDVVQKGPDIPHRFVLEQNFPNPFNPTTVICYRLPAVTDVTLRVYDILGREVATLVDAKKQSAGRYSVRWDGANRNREQLAPGIYFYQLTTETDRQMKKAVIIR